MTINPVSTYVPTNYGTMTGTTYPLSIDGDIGGVAARSISNFAPHEHATYVGSTPTSAANMTVMADAGFILNAATNVLSEVARQTSGTITAPVTHPRIDRMVVDATSGTLSIVTGTEAVSPVAPDLPVGKLPLAQIALTTGTTSITNSLISDERALNFNVGVGMVKGALTITGSTQTITTLGYDFYTLALQANCTFTVSAGVDGQRLRLRLIQDATGSRTVTFDSSVKFGTTISSFTATTTANATDIVELIYNSAQSKWDFVWLAKGF